MVETTGSGEIEEINTWQLSAVKIKPVDRSKHRHKIKLKWTNDLGTNESLTEEFNKATGDGSDSLVLSLLGRRVISFRKATLLKVQVSEIHRIRQSISTDFSEKVDSVIARSSELEPHLKESELCHSTSKMTVSLIFGRRVDRTEEAQDALDKVAKTSKESAENAERASALGKTAFTALSNVCDVGGSVAQLNPVSAAIFACLNNILTRIKQQDQQDQVIESLIASMVGILPFATLVDLETGDQGFASQAATRILEIVKQTAQFVEGYRRDGKAVRVLRSFVSTSAQDEVDEFRTRFTVIEKEFDRAIAQETRDAAVSVDDERLLATLNPVKNSDFDFDENRFCMPGTRVNILEELDCWSSDSSVEHSMQWLYGMAGLGKSAIAISFCKNLKDANCLAASFICLQNDPLRSQPKLVIPTLAFRFARFWPAYRKRLLVVLRDDPEVTSRPVGEQMRRLMINPIQPLTRPPPSHSAVFVVDGLDECGSETDLTRNALISALSALSGCASWIRVFVTGRPELLPSFDEIDNGHLLRRNLYDEPGTIGDITHFLQVQLRAVASKKRFLKDRPDWPGESNISQLADHAQGLFIWAQTVYLLLYHSSDPDTLLYDLLSDKVVQAGYGTLHTLYSRVLKKAVGDLDDDCRRFRTAMGAIIAISSLRSLPDSALVQLLFDNELNEEVFDNQVSDLSAVLYRDWNGAAKVYHLSFAEFVQDTSPKSPCPKEYQIDMMLTHTELTVSCLSRMNGALRFNCFGMETSSLLNSDPAMLPYVLRAKSEPLSYCCSHWGDHLALSKENDPIISKQVLSFLRDGKSLAWLETVSLTDSMNSSVRTVVKVMRWSRVGGLASESLAKSDCNISKSPTDEIFITASDLRRYILTFYTPISRSAPHIYTSALTFVYQTNRIREQVQRQRVNSTAMTRGLEHEKSPLLLSWQAHSDFVRTLKLSNDGRFVVSCSYKSDPFVRAWDAMTGCQMYSLDLTQSGIVAAVAFTPDCHKMAVASADGSISLWMLRSGDPLGQSLIKSPASHVTAIALSSDNRHLLAAYEDNQIVLWSLVTRRMVGKPIDHEEPITDVAFDSSGQIFSVASIVMPTRQTPTPVRTPASFTLRNTASTRMERLPVAVKRYPTFCISVSLAPSGNQIAALTEQLEVFELQDETLRLLNRKEWDNFDGAGTVQWSRDSKSLIVTSTGNRFDVLDPSTFDVLSSVNFANEDDYNLRCLDVNPEGLILTGHSDGTIRTFETVKSGLDEAAVDINPGKITAASFSMDGTKVLVGYHTGHLSIVDTSKAGSIRPVVSRSTVRIELVRFCFDSGLALVARDGLIELYSTADLSRTSELSFGNRQTPYAALDGFHYAMETDSKQDKAMQIFSTSGGQLAPEPRLVVAHGRWPTFSPTSTEVALRVHDVVQVYDLESLQVIRAVTIPGSRCTSMSIGVHGNPLCVLRTDEFDTAKAREFLVEENAITEVPQSHKHNVLQRAFSHCGRYAATVCMGSVIRVMDVQRWQLLGEELTGHLQEGNCLIRGIEWSSDDRYILSGSFDGSVRVWNAAAEVAKGHGYVRPDGIRWDSQNEGWLCNDEGLVLWVPVEHRRRVFGQEVLVIPDEGDTRRIEIDWDRLKYGRHWAE